MQRCTRWKLQEQLTFPPAQTQTQPSTQRSTAHDVGRQGSLTTFPQAVESTGVASVTATDHSATAVPNALPMNEPIPAVNTVENNDLTWRTLRIRWKVVTHQRECSGKETGPEILPVASQCHSDKKQTRLLAPLQTYEGATL